VTEPIAALFSVPHLIAALPEEDEHGNITGKLAGTPTQGPGKVTHMHAWLERLGSRFEDFERCHFYSDSHNDLPLLSIVSHPVATNPSAKLAAHAQAQGWPTIHLFND
jgi:phosphoserine phosphatase